MTVTVCHLTSVHPYRDARIFSKECQTLTQAGYTTHLVAPDAPNTALHGVRLHGIPTASGRLQRMLLGSWHIYGSALRINADLYHFHDPELIPIGLLLQAQGKHVIYDIHEDMPENIFVKPYLPAASHWSMSRMIDWLERFAGRRFSALITATPAIARRFYAINPHTTVINNYPRRDEFDQTPPAWHTREQAITYIGSISNDRGILTMVDAMRHLPKHRAGALLLAGSFGVPYEYEAVQARPGWQRVRELGILNRTQVVSLLGSVRAGLVLFLPNPCHIVAQPTKLYEYMAAGIPVIASDFPLWRELITRHTCGLLVDPFNSHAIARAIEVLLANPDMAEAMGRNGREAVQQHYNWDREAQKLVALYRNILGG